jgi:hypothetical protein
MLWVLIAAVSNPLSNPYVRKRKLSTCSQWLQSWLKITNTAFDDLAIFIAPYIHVQSRNLGRCRSCAGSFSSTSTAFPRRQRARPRNHATAIVFLAVTMGFARAQAYCANPGPSVAHHALFDSDSFDILVDGGATASIPNCLADFIQPLTTTNIRIKGFNGAYSAARIGTVCPSAVPNNSVNPPGTSSKVYDEPDRPNVIPFDLDDNQEDTNLTNQDDVTSSLDASAELMR